MQRRTLIILGTLLLCLAAALFIFRSAVTGLVTLHETAQGVLIGGDTITIPQGSLTTCCTFTDTAGKNKTCKVIAPYGCGYCAPYC
jgi:hypothetical protein